MLGHSGDQRDAVEGDVDFLSGRRTIGGEEFELSLDQFLIRRVLKNHANGAVRKQCGFMVHAISFGGIQVFPGHASVGVQAQDPCAALLIIADLSGLACQDQASVRKRAIIFQQVVSIVAQVAGGFRRGKAKQAENQKINRKQTAKTPFYHF